MEIKMKLGISLFLSMVLSTSFASNVSNTFQTSAQMQAACAIQIEDFNFGLIDYKNDKTMLKSLEITCNKGVVAVGTLSKGNSDTFDRYMTDGTAESDFLKYFVNIPGGSSLGDGTSGTVKFTITGTGGQDFKWIAISVLRGQYFKPGNYSDSLTMTLTY